MSVLCATTSAGDTDSEDASLLGIAEVGRRGKKGRVAHGSVWTIKKRHPNVFVCLAVGVHLGRQARSAAPDAARSHPSPIWSRHVLITQYFHYTRATCFLLPRLHGGGGAVARPPRSGHGAPRRTAHARRQLCVCPRAAYQPIQPSGHTLHAPLGSLVAIRLRCSPSHASSRHTPPPGTSYGHTRTPRSCAVSCVSTRCTAACLRSGSDTGMEERDVKETQVPSTRDRSSGCAVRGESYGEY